MIGDGAISTRNNNSSIWYLGLNAFSSLLSPSKSQESINIYKSYKKFITDTDFGSEHDETAKSVLMEPFIGFDSNRFGRLAKLSTLFMKHSPLIKQFFGQAVDEHQNKLQLACYSYLRSGWFNLCCEIVAQLDTLLVDPLMLAIGIDKYKKVKSANRSWYGLKELFPKLLSKLETNEDLKFYYVETAKCRHFYSMSVMSTYTKEI